MDKIEFLLVIKDQLYLDETPSMSDHIEYDLGADSLDCIELTMRMEDDFNIEITGDEMEAVVTVKDAWDLCAKKCQQP